MHTLDPTAPCHDHFEAVLFFRHHRLLRAVYRDAQAWFCLPDISRLMGARLDERATVKLDPDQRRMGWVEAHGRLEKCVLVSESGVYALLIHHYIPENRSLRQWLAHEVLPQLRRLNWLGSSLLMLHWRDKSWMRWEDMPQVLPHLPVRKPGLWNRVLGSLRSDDRR